MHPDSSMTQDGKKLWLALYQSMANLSSTLDPQRVLEIALEESGAVIASQGGQPKQLVRAALLFAEEQTQPPTLQVNAMCGLSPEDCAIELSEESSLIRQVLREGEARLTQEIKGDPELARFAALRSCREIYCIPLRKPSPEGVLLFGHPQAGFFTAERCMSLDLLAGQTWTAYSNARRFRENQLKIEHILDMYELNRAELGRELHDGPIQSVAALAMRANIARRLASRQAPDMVEELEKIEAIARQATSDLRQLLVRLHPQLLESKGLAAALHELAGKTSQVHGILVQILVEPEILPRLVMVQQAAIFDLVGRVLRETSKKEGVEAVQVRLSSGSSGQAVLEIEVDGLVTAARVWSSPGTTAGGKQSIQEPVNVLRGTVEYDVRGERSSCLRVVIPLEEKPESTHPGSP